MSVDVKISSILTRYTNKQQTAKVNGSTVGECLENLVEQFPELRRVLFNKDGRLQHYIDVYINGESVYPEELAKPVKDGDNLHLLMVIAGG